jgi:hypothetical protein
MRKNVSRILGFISIAFCVLFCGVSAWRAHHGVESSGGLAVIMLLMALVLYQGGSRILRSQR